MPTYNNSTNDYSTSRFLVSQVAGFGNYLTIQSAVTAASTGDTIYIMDGSYTENITMKAGVALSSIVQDSHQPNVLIIGKLTCSYSGECDVSGISFQTNGDYSISVVNDSCKIGQLSISPFHKSSLFIANSNTLATKCKEDGERLSERGSKEQAIV